MTVVDLLSDGGRRALEIKERYEAPLTKSRYLSLMRGMFREEHWTE